MTTSVPNALGFNLVSSYFLLGTLKALASVHFLHINGIWTRSRDHGEKKKPITLHRSNRIWQLEAEGQPSGKVPNQRQGSLLSMPRGRVFPQGHGKCTE